MLTVTNEIASAIAPVKKKTVQPMFVLKAKPWSHFVILYQASGMAIAMAINTILA